MRESNTHATKKERIQCLEVLISKSYITRSNSNLLWTLSVYSLENRPVKKNRALHNSEIFHFMLYDWKKTIKQLLEEQQVPYSIIEFFSPDNLYSESFEVVHSSDDEKAYLSALDAIEQNGGTSSDEHHDLQIIPEREQVDHV